MENNIPAGHSTFASTVSGTLLVVLVQITSGKIIKTMILAAFGAAVSFLVSQLLKRMVKKRK
jgi:mannitol-specific phosphotransferase system IIBC component